MRIASKQVLNAVAISATNVVTSEAIPLDHMRGYSIALTTTSTATGAAKLQASVDNLVWVDLPNSGATANTAVSGAGSSMWNVPDAFYRSVRVVYTNATNSGALSVTFFAKGTE